MVRRAGDGVVVELGPWLDNTHRLTEQRRGLDGFRRGKRQLP